MFESIINFFKKIGKQEKETVKSKDAAKERLHLVLMQDRANVSADFLDLMKQEIIEVIKKYIDVDENAIDVRLTNKTNGDGTNGAPALYANIPIVSIKEDVKRVAKPNVEEKEEQTEAQNSNNEQEQIEEDSTIKSEPKPYENTNDENKIATSEQQPYENINGENTATINEPKTYEDVAQENNIQKVFENINQVNNTIPKETITYEDTVQQNNITNETKAYENVAQPNKIEQELEKQETQALNPNKEQVTENYTRTF